MVVDVFEDVLGPFHKVTDLIARRRSIHVPGHLLHHLFSKDVLEGQAQLVKISTSRIRRGKVRTNKIKKGKIRKGKATSIERLDKITTFNLYCCVNQFV